MQYATENLMVVCDCDSIEHQFRLCRDEADCWIEVHLSPRLSFVQRLWAALKYVSGYQTPWGGFETVLVSVTNACQMIDLLKAFCATRPSAPHPPSKGSIKC